MKLKTVTVGDKVYAEVVDGKPVYIHDEGDREVPFDAPAATRKISELNGEAMGHRQAKEAIEAQLKLYEGIEDPEAAKTALETVKNIKDGDLIAAGKVSEIKEAARLAAEERVASANRAHAELLAAANKERDELRDTLNRELIGGGFSRSKFIQEKGSVPSDIFEARFGSLFKVEDGNKVIGHYPDGNKVYSVTTPGEIADFDEALEILVERYPHKSSLLKGTGGGSGGRAGNGAGAPLGDKVLTRHEFDALDPTSRSQKMAQGYKVVDTAA